MKHKPFVDMGKEFNLSTGKLGEKIAEDYLKKRGYKIIDRNFKTKYGEIDLVCLRGNKLIIIEVRTKIGENFGSPEDSLNKNKLRKIWLNARNYSAGKKWRGDVNIDAVCIVLNSDKIVERIAHYQNIV